MPDIPRLNGVIRALEEGKTAFVGFAPVDIESAVALASAPYDGIRVHLD
jgi:4-hydroxy-2-oxoheptanedioate aldolase